MRITFASQFRDGAAGIQKASEQLLEAQRQVSTGRRLDKISVDPSGSATAVAERNALGAVEQYERTADSAASRLAVIDTVLSDIVDKLTKAQSSAMAGQGSTKSTVQREAAAQELRGLKTSLLDDLNTMFHGTFVFSGISSTTKPYTVGGGGVVGAYGGSATEMSIDVGDGRSVKIALDGSAIAQGGASQHVFDTFDDLIAAVVSGNDAGITTGLQELQDAFTRATGEQSRLGTDMAEIDAQKLRLQQVKLSTTERLSKLEEANMAEAITQMSNADAAYRAALGAVSTSTRVSLLDYLK
jgi:flagellar hook-associated protein 3 FlgL